MLSWTRNQSSTNGLSLYSGTSARVPSLYWLQNSDDREQKGIKMAKMIVMYSDNDSDNKGYRIYEETEWYTFKEKTKNFFSEKNFDFSGWISCFSTRHITAAEEHTVSSILGSSYGCFPDLLVDCGEQLEIPLADL